MWFSIHAWQEIAVGRRQGMGHGVGEIHHGEKLEYAIGETMATEWKD